MYVISVCCPLPVWIRWHGQHQLCIVVVGCCATGSGPRGVAPRAREAGHSVIEALPGECAGATADGVSVTWFAPRHQAGRHPSGGLSLTRVRLSALEMLAVRSFDPRVAELGCLESTVISWADTLAACCRTRGQAELRPSRVPPRRLGRRPPEEVGALGIPPREPRSLRRFMLAAGRNMWLF